MNAFLTDTMPVEPGWIDISLRIALTVLAGGLIGLNRERGGHAAGFRTTILVALAACIAMIQANLLLSTFGNVQGSFTQMDVLRFPLGILTGVGFIGGGVILRRGEMMAGVTTAATLWFMTVVGLSFGGGQFVTGLAATAIAFVVLSSFRGMDSYMRCQQRAAVSIQTSGSDVPELSTALESVKADAYFVSLEPSSDGGSKAVFELRWRAADRDAEARKVLKAISDRHQVVDFTIKSSMT